MEHTKRDSGVTSNRAFSLPRGKGGRHPSTDAGTSSDTESRPSPSIGSSPSTQLLELHSAKGHEKPFFNNAWDVDDNGLGPSASVTNNQSRKGRPGFRTRKYSAPSGISPDEFTFDVATQLPQQPVEELQPSFEVEGEGGAEADIDTDFVSMTPEPEATTKRRKRSHFRSRSLRNSNARLSNPEEQTPGLEGNADADIDTDFVSVVPDLGTAARKKRMRSYSRSRSRTRQNSNTRKNSGPPSEHLDESFEDEFANPVVRSRPIRTPRVDDLIPSPPLNIDVSPSQPSSPEQPTLTRSLTRKRRAKNKGRLEVLSKLTDGKVVEPEPGNPSNSMAKTFDFMRTDEENVDAHINNLERSSAHRVHPDSTANTIAEQFFYQFLRGSRKMKGWSIVIEQNNGDKEGRRAEEHETEDFALISPNSFIGANQGPSFAGSIMLSDQGGSRGPKKKQSLTDILLPYDTPSSGNELVLNPSPVTASRQLETPLTPEQDATLFDQNLVLVTAQEHHSWSPPPVIPQQSRQVHRDSSQNPKLQISNLPLFELQRSKVTLSRSISTPERTPLTGETSKNYISSRPEVNMEKIRSMLSNGPRSRDFGREHSPCLPGTREGLLKRIHHWVQDPTAPNVATLHGHPGTGKSTLTTSLVRELGEQDILGAHFFCRREQYIQHNPRDLWCLIALKLIQKYPAAAETFALLMEDKLSDPSSLSIEDLFDVTIRRPLLSVSADRPIVVVIDALDQFGGSELNSSVRSELLRSLDFWRGLPTHCRLYITTRGQGDLSTVLKSSANFTLDSGTRRSTETDEDIHLYFKSHFSRIAGRFKGLSRTWPSESDIRLLTSSAAGLFIWAKTIVNKVENRPTALSSIVSQVRSGSLAIEGDLTRIYVSILEHVFPGSPIPPSFKLVTSAIISTQDSLPTPLSHLALSRLLSLDEIEVHEICLALQVVLCDEDNPKIFHQSFVDFLVSEYCPPSFRVERSLQLAKNRVFFISA
ncbi:hypothetical protein DL96DRAFT_983592 [Flagelloscypha sp. PMI_526]|nr:hypothetical protein DL96DRAFT_983592 [Flagelloscypha sp. PMI_526]